MIGKHPFWKYGLFQIPAAALAICLSVASVTALLNLDCPRFWTALFWGLAGIASVWTLVLPLDRFLQSVLGFKMGFAGRVAIYHALFWTVAIVAVLLSTLPILRQSCSVTMASQTVQSSDGAVPSPSPVPSPSISSSPTIGASPSPSPEASPEPTPVPTPDDQELMTIDWSRWKANIWNKMFLNQRVPGEIGSKAQFSFVVYRDGRIDDIKIQADDLILKEFVGSRIANLAGTDALIFIELSKRDFVNYKSDVTVCTRDVDYGCNDPDDPSRYPDSESVTR